MHIFHIRKNALKPFQKLLTMSFHSSKSDSAEFKSLLSKARNVAVQKAAYQHFGVLEGYGVNIRLLN
jgi:hypothetical protein